MDAGPNYAPQLYASNHSAFSFQSPHFSISIFGNSTFRQRIYTETSAERCIWNHLRATRQSEPFGSCLRAFMGFNVRSKSAVGRLPTTRHVFGSRNQTLNTLATR